MGLGNSTLSKIFSANPSTTWNANSVTIQPFRVISNDGYKEFKEKGGVFTHLKERQLLKTSGMSTIDLAKLNGETVVVKSVDPNNLFELEGLKNETIIMEQLSNSQSSLFPKMYAYSKTCIVMEYIDGITLEALTQNPKNLPLWMFLEITKSVLEGLSILHTLTPTEKFIKRFDLSYREGIKGYVHRDIKPANIMIDSNLNIKLIDLGIICPNGYRQKEFSGTPNYLAPEMTINDLHNQKKNLAKVSEIPPIFFSTCQKISAKIFGNQKNKTIASMGEIDEASKESLLKCFSNGQDLARIKDLARRSRDSNIYTLKNDSTVELPSMKEIPPNIQPATDIYSLGITLYKILTGKNPMQGTTLEEIKVNQCTKELPALPYGWLKQRFSSPLPLDLSDEHDFLAGEINNLVARMTVKKPAERPSSQEILPHLQTLRAYASYFKALEPQKEDFIKTIASLKTT